jgi:hypothetical protein
MVMGRVGTPVLEPPQRALRRGKKGAEEEEGAAEDAQGLRGEVRVIRSAHTVRVT